MLNLKPGSIISQPRIRTYFEIALITFTTRKPTFTQIGFDLISKWFYKIRLSVIRVSLKFAAP